MAKKTAEEASPKPSETPDQPQTHPRVAELMRRGYGRPLAEETLAKEQATKPPAAEGAK